MKESITDLVLAPYRHKSVERADKRKLCLFDSGIFMGYMTKKYKDESLKSGFIKKVKGNIYQTDMSFLGLNED